MANNCVNKESKQSGWLNIREKFTFSYWRHNYLGIALLLVASICWYRRTTDGLFFIAPVLIQLAWKFEIYKKYDLSFALWKKEKKTLREFGYARAISSILCPNLVKDRSENDYAVHMVWQAIFVILILHIYVFVVIIIHAINPKLINPIFIYINNYYTVQDIEEAVLAAQFYLTDYLRLPNKGLFRQRIYQKSKEIQKGKTH